MEPIDATVQLKFNNGNNFPTNFVIIGYILLVASLLLILTESFLFGSALMLVSLFPVTNRQIILIDSENNFIHDYGLYLGFLKIGKKYPLNKYKYVTTMPLIESQQMYASTSNSTIISNSYTTVTFFGERFRGKRVISKFDSRNEAIETAQGLGQRLSLKFFEYDPKLVREVLLGHRSI